MSSKPPLRSLSAPHASPLSEKQQWYRAILGALFLLALLLLAIGGSALAFASAPTTELHATWATEEDVAGWEGVKRVERAFPPTLNQDALEVIVFVNYACGHCATFDPVFREWQARTLLPVKITKMSIGGSGFFGVMTHTDLALEVMDQEFPGIRDQAGIELYSAIHTDGQRWRTLEDVATFLEGKALLDRERFLAAAENFTVRTKMRQNVQRAARLGVWSTPTVVIDETWLLGGVEADLLGERLRAVAEFQWNQRKP